MAGQIACIQNNSQIRHAQYLIFADIRYADICLLADANINCFETMPNLSFTEIINKLVVGQQRPLD